MPLRNDITRTYDGRRILVVAAHPDDETLGCGGTIARLSAEGHSIKVAVLGEGITSRNPHREFADQREVEELQARCLQACELLGVKEVDFLRLPDNRFDTLALLEVIKLVEGLIDDFQPVELYTHHGGDLNVDHQITFRAVLTATRPFEGRGVKRLLSFEVPSSTEWSFGSINTIFNPGYFFNIDKTLDAKIKAIACYETEYEEFPHPRSSRAIKALAEFRGATAGLKAAEAFEVVRWIS